MRKINTNDVDEDAWSSPKGRYVGYGKQVSVALGREPRSTDLLKRHPFDIEILRVPPGKTPYPFHAHSAQWEFYHVIAGKGDIRDPDGTTPVIAGDAFIFEPGKAHQITNTGSDDLIVYVIADNPIGEMWYYPDSDKSGVPLPERKNLRSEHFDYYDGEE